LSKVDKLAEIRERAESDLLYFAKLINPHRVYGSIHEELFSWWQKEERKDNTLVLLPRDHQKSHCAAVYAAWKITSDPTRTLLYVSATALLAEKQLYAIKNLLTSKVYSRYWPDMVTPEEGKREKWSNTEICVDHPSRKVEGVRDSTVFAAGLTTNITGFHATDVFLDDVVVPNNAYTNEGRDKVATMFSQLASIETTGAKEVVVGTRYHPTDLYNTLIEMQEEIFDDDGEQIGRDNVYEVFQRVVETDNEFLWPKQRRADGKVFGFDVRELARKKAKYVDTTQFFAQYYNNPNDPSNDRINRDRFQYYDRKHLEQMGGDWQYKGKKLNVYASIDFAFSLRKRADFSSIVVLGIDAGGFLYVLDIDRFKTDKISVYFSHIKDAVVKWGFRKLRAEVSVAQQIIVNDLKDKIREDGLVLSVDENRPNRHQGAKEERMAAILEPRYENMSVWHYKGGNCQLLEEELIMNKPPHDDIKDALSSVIEIATPPRRYSGMETKRSNVVTHSRFGGVAYR